MTILKTLRSQNWFKNKVYTNGKLKKNMKILCIVSKLRMLRINCIKFVYHKKRFLDMGKAYENRTNKKREGFEILSIPLLGFCSFMRIYRVFVPFFVKLFLICMVCSAYSAYYFDNLKYENYLCMYGYVWVIYLLSLR